MPRTTTAAKPAVRAWSTAPVANRSIAHPTSECDASPETWCKCSCHAGLKATVLPINTHAHNPSATRARQTDGRSEGERWCCKAIAK